MKVAQGNPLKAAEKWRGKRVNLINEFMHV
jgi:hypothetical protein